MYENIVVKFTSQHMILGSVLQCDRLAKWLLLYHGDDQILSRFGREELIEVYYIHVFLLVLLLSLYKQMSVLIL